MAPPRQSVRLVIQFVRDLASAQSSYRIVIYPAPQKSSGPLLFSSRETLVQQLRAVIPGFDGHQIQADEPTTSEIVFADTLELTESQLARLCLAH
jgi:hypothetical protein